jgi:radical SAM superfamily enzyme YgiQ (UPF0313 family)
LKEAELRFLLIEPKSCWLGLNLGSAYVAGALKAAGHEVLGLSLTNHRGHDDNALQRRFVESFKPDAVGYSLFYTSVKSFKRNMADLRTYYAGASFVGGPQLNLECEELFAENHGLDYAFLGESEVSVCEFAEVLAGKRSIASVPGMAYRAADKINHTPERPPDTEWENRPYPDFGVFGIRRIRNYLLSSSRGCPFRCYFCNRNSDHWRPRSPVSMIAELRSARNEYEIESFTICDDSMNIKPDRVIEFCDRLLDSGLNLPWDCSGVRADRLPADMLERMAASGCRDIAVGVESLRPEIFSTLNKGETLEEITEGIKRALKANIRVHGYFMIGLPGDDRKGVLETYRKAKKLGLSSLGFSILLPFPKTRIHDSLKSHAQVKWLHDYHDVTTAWAYDKEWSDIKSSFELPEFPALEKIDLFNRFWTLRGEPRPPYHPNLMIFGWRVMKFVLKYDPFKSPVTLFRLAKSLGRRLMLTKGRTVFKSALELDPRHLELKP